MKHPPPSFFVRVAVPSVLDGVFSGLSGRLGVEAWRSYTLLRILL